MSKRGRIGIDGVEELMRAVQGFERGGPQVAARALNKTAGNARTEAVRLLRQLLNLKAKDIRSGLSIHRANPKSLRAAVIARGKRGVPLAKYPVRPGRPNPKRPPAKGVSVQIKRFGGSKVVKGAFVSKMKSGHTGVYRRQGAKRLPIKELYGPNFVQYLDGGRVRRKLDRLIGRRLEHNLRHEINWQIQKQFNQIKGAR
ncbi:phage tail protein [Desulfovibrio oxyclinae]|uniref:phage tail protein n=1 Tax=Desulfovibrio oxyclinae TaxID=63560 RepID=UPI00037A9C9D|nr:phage tail protein [Desulfovibrio oxyclinae]